MKVCVLYYDKQSSNTCKDLASSFASGIMKQGEDCDIVDMGKETGKIISYYDYIAVIVPPASLWGGKVPEATGTFLRQCGTISGKRSAAFISKGSIRSTKTLQALFKLMEAQGMYLTYSDVLANNQIATESGKRIKLG
ncbi:MAG: hypothetical protein PQJ47_10695 [Sphaerochaetaceae bacterium]|nr:hypothetical protein [Sphaerochaetaceae bacterium]